MDFVKPLKALVKRALLAIVLLAPTALVGGMLIGIYTSDASMAVGMLAMLGFLVLVFLAVAALYISAQLLTDDNLRVRKRWWS